MSQSFKQECDFANDMQAYICMMPQGFQAEITREELQICANFYYARIQQQQEEITQEEY